MPQYKDFLRSRRKTRIRAKISGTALRPRLVINRTLQGHFAQLIDDENHKTLVGIHDKNIKDKKSKTENAKTLGKEIAKKAQEIKIQECVFDRNGYKYTGRVKAFADAAREGGLKF